MGGIVRAGVVHHNTASNTTKLIEKLIMKEHTNYIFLIKRVINGGYVIMSCAINMALLEISMRK